MKKIIFTLILLTTIFSNSHSQEALTKFKTNAKGELELSEVVNCSNSGKMLYSNAQEWITKSFGNYKSVIQLENIEALKLIMKSSMDIGFSYKSPTIKALDTWYKLNFVITIECKNNKFRYTISDIITEHCNHEECFLLGESHAGTGSRLQHIEYLNNALEERKEKLIKLKEEDDESINEKEKEPDYLISFFEREIENHKEWLSKELIIILSIGDSLKEAMCVDNDF